MLNCFHNYQFHVCYVELQGEVCNGSVVIFQKFLYNITCAKEFYCMGSLCKMLFLLCFFFFF
uniref:Uncharacterized protein n=1 Tax=Rhizophora mucronata TaxID=61149 RepID=A0A2P2PZY2_RHIMU